MRRGSRRLFRLERLLHLQTGRELDEELAFHFEATVEALMSEGMERDSAEREAARRFGDRDRWRKRLEREDRAAARERRRGDWVSNRAQDLRHAARALARSPVLTAGVVLTFALGLGANATIFGILDRLFLSPPAHVEAPDEVRRVFLDRYVSFIGERVTGSSLTYPDYEDLTRAGAFEAVGAYATRDLTVGSGEDAYAVDAVLATASFLDLLGTRPAAGRFYTTAEDVVGGEPVAVLGHGLWQRRFGGDEGVIGRAIDFGEGPHTIIGVAPAGFTGVDLAAADLWLPLHAVQAELAGTRWQTSRNWWWLGAVARLADGVTLEAAEAEATTLHRAARADDIAAGNHDAEARLVMAPLLLARGPMSGGEARVAAWLAGVSLVVLLVACANIANLLLARALRRRRETGIRLALGISRSRLIGQTLTETLLLALLGGAAALAVARFGGGLVRRVLLPDVAWTDSAVGPRVLLFIVAAAVLAAGIAGILPAIQAARHRVSEALASTSRGATEGSRARHALTLVQAALSVVLLVGAGLFVRSLDRVQGLDMGFEPEGLLTVEAIQGGGEEDRIGRRTEAANARSALYYRLQERVAALPGVENATVTFGLPFWSSWSVGLRVPGWDSLPTLREGGPYIITGGSGYFETMGLRILRGRGFTPADDVADGAPVAVVNEAMAAGLWPDGDALGECLIIGDDEDCTQVVGVAENARRQAIVENQNWLYYVPQKQIGNAPEALVVRVTGDPAAAVQSIRRAILAAEPGLRYAEVRPLRDLIAPQARSWEMGATLFTLFGLLALAVAGIGLYSVLAFEVTQRSRELGIRTALGATRKRLLRMVLGQGLRVTALGLAVGGVAAWLLAPRLQELLFETSPRDPWIFAGVMALLLVVAVLASGFPALRATRVDPGEVLQAE